MLDQYLNSNLDVENFEEQYGLENITYSCLVDMVFNKPCVVPVLCSTVMHHENIPFQNVRMTLSHLKTDILEKLHLKVHDNNVEKIEIENKQSVPLDHLRHFKELRELNLHLSTFTPTVSKLQFNQLIDLNLSESGITELSVFTDNTPKLKYLNLAACKSLTDSPFKLPELEKIDLRYSSFSDISILTNGGAENLREINLSSCYSLDTKNVITPVKLQKLEEISFYGSNFDNMSILTSGGLDRLKKIDLSRCKSLTSNKVQSPMKLPDVETLNFYDSSFDDMALLSGLKKLKTIYLSKCKSLTTKNVNGTLELPEVEEIDVSGSSFDDMSILTGLTNLRKLNLERCQKLSIKQLTKPINLPNLCALELGRCNLSNSEALFVFSLCTKLREKHTDDNNEYLLREKHTNDNKGYTIDEDL